MSINQLLACLRAIQQPADTEEWLIRDQPRPTEPVVSEEYRRAVHDMLTALGVLSEANTVASPMAYYFVQSLLVSLRDGTLSPAMWQGLAGQECSGTGARLVRLLESHRVTCADNPTPLRVIAAVTAVIKARRADGDVYLMQYDDKAERFQPIGGKRETSDADNQAALIRELCEELSLPSLSAGQDLRIHPLREHAYSSNVSATIHVVTRYDHSFYHLTDIRFPLHTDHITRWIAASELDAGQTTDGYAITSLFDEYIPGVLPTLGYSIAEHVS